MSRFSTHIKNAIKGSIILMLASFLFTALITIFPLVGSIFSSNFPMNEVLMQHLKLFLQLAAIGVPLGVMIGIIAPSVKQRKLFWYTVIGLISYWITVMILIIFSIGLSAAFSDPGALLLLSLWAILAYSFFALPLITLAIFLILRWTRK